MFGNGEALALDTGTCKIRILPGPNESSRDDQFPSNCSSTVGLIGNPLTVLANQACKAELLRVCALVRIFRRDPGREALSHAAKLFASIRGGHRICGGLRILNRDEAHTAGTNVEINANRTF